MNPIAPTQAEFDWLIGHSRPWLTTDDIARPLSCSRDHVSNLILDGSLDWVIDIRTQGSRRPTYRIFRPSFDRFLGYTRNRNSRPLHSIPETDLDSHLANYLNTQRIVLASWEVARHLNCTEQHVLNLGSEIALDLSRASSVKCYPRTTRLHLIEFIKKRRVIP